MKLDHSATFFLLKGKCNSEPCLKAKLTNCLLVREANRLLSKKFQLDLYHSPPTKHRRWSFHLHNTSLAPTVEGGLCIVPNIGSAPGAQVSAAGPQPASAVGWKHYLKDNNSLSSSGQELSFFDVFRAQK